MSIITVDRCGAEVNESNLSSSETEVSDVSSTDFLISKTSVISLTSNSRRPSTATRPFCAIESHLTKIVSLLRGQDSIKLVVSLEPRTHRDNFCRYLCIVSTVGKSDTEESIFLGVDMKQESATIGLVLPIFQDLQIKLDGEGMIKVLNKDTEKVFKPKSVQALWKVFQATNKCCEIARYNSYYPKGLNHDWIEYYRHLPESDFHQLQEWQKTEDIETFGNATIPLSVLSENATEEEKQRVETEQIISHKLKEIMCTVDLEEVTVIQLRTRLEELMGMSMVPFKHFIQDNVLRIYGQMDESCLIFDHLLLGSTFNASNKEELERKNVSHVLNISREVDNFFPGDRFIYKNVREYDNEETDLMPYWEETYHFINAARERGTKCLVHCKMGISRSAATVIAYAMKDKQWELEEAFEYVKSKRPIIKPNAAFMKQLSLYKGILDASSNRHKPIFKGDQSLDKSKCSSTLTADQVSSNSLPSELPSFNASSSSCDSATVNGKPCSDELQLCQTTSTNSSTTTTTSSSLTNRPLMDLTASTNQQLNSSAFPSASVKISSSPWPRYQTNASILLHTDSVFSEENGSTESAHSSREMSEHFDSSQFMPNIKVPKKLSIPEVEGRSLDVENETCKVHRRYGSSGTKVRPDNSWIIRQSEEQKVDDPLGEISQSAPIVSPESISPSESPHPIGVS